MREFIGDLRHRPALLLAVSFLVVVILLAVFAPIVTVHEPNTLSRFERLVAPSSGHWLGTDRFGRDLFSRIIFGSRVSLFVAALSITVGVLVGGAMGVVSGYLRGKVDEIIMRGVDILFAFPPLLLAIALAAALGPSARNAAIAIAIIYIPVFARVARARVLMEVSNDYVAALKVIGASSWRISVRHLVPNISTPIAVQVSLGLAQALLLESALSFLGLGAQVPTASWGSILGEGRFVLTIAPWMTLAAGAVIILTVLSLFILADGIRDALDPKGSR